MRRSSMWKRRLVAGLAMGIATAFLVAGGTNASPDDWTWLGGSHTQNITTHLR